MIRFLSFVLTIHSDTLWSFDGVMQKIAEKGFYCVSMAQRGYYPSSLVEDIPQKQGEFQRYGKHLLGRDILHVIEKLNKDKVWQSLNCTVCG